LPLCPRVHDIESPIKTPRGGVRIPAIEALRAEA
jgi:hypothetical protein